LRRIEVKLREPGEKGSRFSKEGVHDSFKALTNGMRVATHPGEVKYLVDLGQGVVDNSSSAAYHTAQKKQEDLSKFGERKLRDIGVKKKGFEAGAEAFGAGAHVGKYEERSSNEEDS